MAKAELRAYPNNPLYCGWLQSPMPALSVKKRSGGRRAQVCGNLSTLFF
jgi:hypothetical protein